MNKMMLAALTAAIVLAPPSAYADATKGEVTKIDTTFLIETANLGRLAKKIVRSIDNGAYEDTVVVTYEVADVCTD